MNEHRGAHLTTAVVSALRTAGLVVGDGAAPASGAGWVGTAGQSTFIGYVVVHPITGGEMDGPLDGGDPDASVLYQLSSYGATRGQSEGVADEARIALLAAALTVTNRVVAHVAVDLLGGARRTDDVQPPIWQTADRFRILTVPPAT